MTSIEDAALRAVAAHGEQVAAVEQTLESMVRKANELGTLTDERVINLITQVFVETLRELNKDPFYSAQGLLRRVDAKFNQYGLKTPEQFRTAVEVEAQSTGRADYHREMLAVAKGARLNSPDM